MKTQAKNIVKDTFRAEIERLKACTNNDYILAYLDHGLGIMFNGKEPRVCGLDMAETIVPEHSNMPEEAWAFTPIVVNGAGEQASIVQRQVAIRTEIEKLQGFLDA